MLALFLTTTPPSFLPPTQLLSSTPRLMPDGVDGDRRLTANEDNSLLSTGEQQSPPPASTPSTRGRPLTPTFRASLSTTLPSSTANNNPKRRAFISVVASATTDLQSSRSSPPLPLQQQRLLSVSIISAGIASASSLRPVRRCREPGITAPLLYYTASVFGNRVAQYYTYLHARRRRRRGQRRHGHLRFKTDRDLTTTTADRI